MIEYVVEHWQQHLPVYMRGGGGCGTRPAGGGAGAAVEAAGDELSPPAPAPADEGLAPVGLAPAGLLGFISTGAAVAVAAAAA